MSEVVKVVKERRLFPPPALNLQGLSRHVLLLAVVYLVVFPLGMLLYGSLSTRLPGEGGSLTLNWYQTVFSSPEVAKVFGITVLLAVPRVLIAIVLATGFAWILARTNTPAKGWLEGLMLFMFFLPNLPWIMAWEIMAIPKIGLLNQVLFQHLPGNFELNVRSYAGIIALGAVRIAPTMYLFVAPAFKAMDASLEESSRMSGANALTTIRRINVPLAMPALTAQAVMAFIAMLESFEIEYLLGVGVGIWVYSTSIWSFIYRTVPPQYGSAAAMSMLLMLVTFSLVVLQWRVLGARIFTVVTGRGYQARPYDLGRWRWLTFSFILAFFFVFILLPFIVLAVNSFVFTQGIYKSGAFTLDWWRFMIKTPDLHRVIWNTIIMGVGAATGGVALVALISYVITKTQWRLRKVLDLVSWTPFTLPGIVMALGYFWAYVFLPLPLYGTIWVLVIVFIARGLPFGCRVMNSTMVQIAPELEESSRIHGASWFYTFRRVMIPLLRPAFIYSWVLLFVFAVRNLDTVIFLAGPKSRVLSTQIWDFAYYGRPEMGIALALVQTGLIVVAYLVAQRFAPRAQIA